MYLPKNQYRIKSTYGGEFQKPSGQEYRGKYIETASGKVYAGGSLAEAKGALLPIPKQEIRNVDRPYNDYIGPSQDDYRRGYFIRYFLQDNRTTKIIEMNEVQWKQKKGLNYVTPGSVTWLLSGPANDGEVNGIPFKGTATKNKEALEILEPNFPGILKFFRPYSEFVK